MKHRTLSLLLALAFLLSVFMLSTTAFAESNTADGLTAVLESDKDAYAAGDNVCVSLTVTNTSEDITNIRTELIIPQGLNLTEGQLVSEAMNLTVGESVEYSYVLSVPVVEIPTTQAPTTQAPTTQAPTTPAPTVPAPTTQTSTFSMICIFKSLSYLPIQNLEKISFTKSSPTSSPIIKPSDA